MNAESSTSGPSAPSGEVGPFATREQDFAPNAGATIFRDDAPGTVASPVQQSSSSLVTSLQEFGEAKSIVDFLKRPTLLTSGSIAVTDSGNLWTADPFAALMASIKSSKLVGVYGIRADVRLILQINAVRFQTGRYILAFVPSGGVVATSAEGLVHLRMHASNLTNITQLPHVEIDVATQTHVELLLPWNSAYPFWVNSSSAPIGFGTAIFRPYVALSAASGDTTAGYSIWASFENITLSGATYTQSGGSFGDREQARAGIGPVEAGLGKVAKAATIIGQLPLIGEAARAVSWSSQVLARAAHVFGWSKPTDISTAKTMVPKPLRFAQNVDGENVSEVLGWSSTNKVNSFPMQGGTSVDEMSIDFIKGIYAWVSTATWTTANVAGDVIDAQQVNPALYSYPLGNGVVPTPLYFLSTMFRQWRGGIKFRLKFVKNEFYSGRLVVYFMPSFHNAGSSPSLTNTEYTYRAIVDIRECNEIEFVCPYIAPELYTPVNYSIGRISYVVLDALVAPNTVPSSITVLTEVAGADDLEFAFPIAPTMEPWVPAVTQSGFAAESQSGFSSPTATKCQTVVLGPSTSNSPTSAAEIAIGEKIESLRQFTRAVAPIVGVTLPTTQVINFTVGATDIVYIRPFSRSIVTQPTSNITAVSRNSRFATLIDLIACCYALETGSMRLAFRSTAETWVGLAQSSAAFWSNASTPGLNTSTARTWSPPMATSGVPSDYIVPSYQLTAGRAVAQNYLNSGSTPVQSTSSLKTAVQLVRFVVGGATDMYFVAGADDFNCWNFVSCPALISMSQA